MGICASCLPGSRRPDSVTEEDFEPTSPLLFSVPNGMHYGSFAEPQMAQQNDTSEAQREIEALQRVVARTSDNMVDVFETAPPKAPTNPYGNANQEARQTWYHALLSRLGNEEDSASEDESEDEDGEDAAGIQENVPRVKAGPNDALVGTFREAAAAMA
ncbi:hypothetical protein VSDG_07813 [Cytospora chrysosperma]|uniref:Late endosomal/lysosomal adaptor and MAPK and MTOR activator 1 n=1 Tax=Cytospora chrysosperma TaxID=252740 RepID=A0A423VK03_CYTCH|nr:hypothetical protein VSDG_07813 [Valsa sordida]